MVTDRASGSIEVAGVWRTLKGGVVAEDPAQWPGDVVGGELGGGNLIQQRLELVVVVTVQQDHVDVMLGELLGASDACKTASHNEHCCVTHASSPLCGDGLADGRAIGIVRPPTPSRHHPRRVMPWIARSSRLGMS